MTIAAFDFDGTLTTRDSMWAFLYFYRGKWGFAWRMFFLSPWIILYRLGLLNAQSTKERVLTCLLKEQSVEQIHRKAKEFSAYILPELLRKEAVERLDWHKEQGHACYLVTASLSFWTQDFAEENGLTLIATLPEIQEGIFTGKINGQNCKGKEKVRRLKEVLRSTPVTESYAYGDSAGDLALLEWADHAFFRKFS